MSTVTFKRPNEYMTDGSWGPHTLGCDSGNYHDMCAECQQAIDQQEKADG